VKLTFFISLLISSLVYAGKSNTGTNSGRFQLIQLSDMRRDQYLLDTQTGKLWTNVCYLKEGDDCEISAWSPEDIIDINANRKDLKALVDAVKKEKEQNK
jgi:hypothetical protein